MNVAGWLATLALHQDFFWALALFAWGVAGWWWWRRRSDPDFAWVPWSATAGVLIAGIELSLLVTPVVPRPGPPSRLAWDAALGAASFLMLFGWGVAAVDRPRRRLVAVVFAGVVLGLVAFLTRDVRPEGWAYANRMAAQAAAAQVEPGLRAAPVIALADVNGFAPVLFTRISTATHSFGAWPLALGLLGMAVLHGCRRRTPPQSRKVWLALLLTVGAVWIGTAGPVADAVHQPRSSTQFSLLGPWSALLHLAAAGALLAALVGANRGDEQENPQEWRAELKRVGVMATVWIVAGFALAAIMGWLARQQFERGALGRARAAAVVVDTSLLARELAANFKFAEIQTLADAKGTYQVAVVPGLAAGALRPIEMALQTVADANPDVTSVSVVTLHQGWLARVCSAARVPGRRTNVPLHRPITALDQANWNERTGMFASPEDYVRAEIVQAFAPLVTNDGRMLGWLWLAFRTPTWNAAQTQARLQTFGTIGLGLGLLGVFYDLRLEARRRDRARLAELAAAEADRAKTVLLAKVSHELRTPIQSILGYGELIAQQPLAPETRGWLESLRAHGQLLTRLVNDLIDLSSLQAGAFRLVPAPGNLGALVRSAIDSLRPRAMKKGLRIECVVSAEAETGHFFDAERVRQVIINLVNNAIKFTDTGQVAIDLRAAAGAPEFFELRVSDTGPGIMPEDQARLFRPFSRLDPARGIEGAGLGLALSHGLCVAMDGTLSVESDGEHGSSFTARWKLPAAPLLPPESAPIYHSLRGRRVLVADDNTLVRELFVSGLRAQGADCESVEDGLAAVERGSNEGFDVIVIDVSMPWLDGVEATRRLRVQAPAALRIVGVSAHASAADRAEAMAAGMDAFLVKPVMLADLVQAVSAGGAPNVRTGTGQLPTLEHLRVLFAREARQIRVGIHEAAKAGDVQRLRVRIHYLKNSADVARYDAISLRCAQLEAILSAGGDPAERLILEIDRDLAPLCEPT